MSSDGFVLYVTHGWFARDLYLVIKRLWCCKLNRIIELDSLSNVCCEVQTVVCLISPHFKCDEVQTSINQQKCYWTWAGVVLMAFYFDVRELMDLWCWWWLYLVWSFLCTSCSNPPSAGYRRNYGTGNPGNRSRTACPSTDIRSWRSQSRADSDRA